MHVVLAGGSGFLGSALGKALVAEGHTVTNLTRTATPTRPNEITWTPDGTAGDWARVVDGADAVVSLAGEGIADARWSDARKRALRGSRISATKSIVAAIQRAAQPPRVLVSGSGIGYYGSRGAEVVTEATPPADDFLGRLCVEWESEAEQASAVTRVALVRTGLVLHTEGGALARMLLPFKLGLGGPIGSGTQYMPWIHRDDWVNLVRRLIAQPDARGAFNGSAPEPVTNAAFAKALGRALRRPAILPLPAFALKVALGEMSELLLTGQRAIPARALEMGFTFRFSTLDAALAELFA